MKRVLTSIVIMLLLPLTEAFAGDGDELLRRLSAAINDLQSYRVEFLITLSAQSGELVGGEYRVDGERYILEMGGAKIYGDNALRYTVDPTNREVIIEPMPSSMPMIVVNPASAFLELDRYFEVEHISQVNGTTELTLTPKQAGGVVERAMIAVDRETMLPRSVEYRADGEQVRVEVNSIERSQSSIPQLNEIGYPADYELIDLR